MSQQRMVVPRNLLSDVYEEAFDEAAYYADAIDAAHEDAEYDLASLARGPERQLFGMLEVLLVDAAPERTELVEALHTASVSTQHRGQVAAMALLRLGERVAVLAGIVHDEPAIRAAAVRACALVHDAEIVETCRYRLSSTKQETEAKKLLTLLAASGASVPALERWLEVQEPSILLPALQLAGDDGSGRYLYWAERHLQHADPKVREAAWHAALTSHAQSGFAACEADALADSSWNPRAMQLYAALGGSSAHRRLEERISSDGSRDDVIFALGFSGNPECIQAMLPLLSGNDERAAKLAFEAIASIAGLDLQDPGLTIPDESHPGGDLPPVEEDPEALASLPPLEEDVASPERHPVDDLPTPNALRVNEWWSRNQSRFALDGRYLGGQPYNAHSLGAYLEGAALRRRHTTAAAALIRSQCAFRLDTRGLSATQRAQLSAVFALPARKLRNPFADF